MITVEELGIETLHSVVSKFPVTGEGFDNITELVYRHARDASNTGWSYCYQLSEDMRNWWDWSWSCDQTDPERTATTIRDGRQITIPVVYRGNFPTRVAQLFRNVTGANIDNSVKERIGNLYSAYRATEQTSYVRLTKDVEWADGTFGDGGSCFWSYNSAARWLIQSEGWALQRFRGMWSDPREFRSMAQARAWVLPYWLRGQRAYIIFNGYSTSEVEDGYGRVLPSLADNLASLLGGHTRKIELSNNGDTCETFYINGGKCILIAPTAELARSIDYIDLDYDVEPYRDGYTCYECGNHIDQDDDHYEYSDEVLCSVCYDRYYFTCDECGDVSRNDYRVNAGSWTYMCNSCARSKPNYCSICCKLVDEDEMVVLASGDKACPSCAEELPTCPDCGKTMPQFYGYHTHSDGKVRCYKCYAARR